MTKRKNKRRKTKNSNSFMIFFIIVIVLAMLSFIITYLVTQTEATTDENAANNQETEITTEKITEKPKLEGTWASYNDGAMLTIKGQDFTIELPSVESAIVASGKIVIKDKTVTFVYTFQASDCGIKPGVYEFRFKNSDEVTLKKIDDTCNARSEQLSATWFRV